MEIITKCDAKNLGLKRFFNGSKCGKGHVEERLVSNGSCVKCHSDRSAKWRSLNFEKVVAQNKSYHSRHGASINARKYAQRADLVATDPYFAETERVRGLIRASLRSRGFSKASRTSEILGCTPIEFRRHIERQFLKGMSWDNRDQWHIDHITPMSSAKNQEMAMRLNNYTNLRPLWVSENLKKNGKAIFLI